MAHFICQTPPGSSLVMVSLPPHPPRPHRPPPIAGSVRSKSPTASCPSAAAAPPPSPPALRFSPALAVRLSGTDAAPPALHSPDWPSAHRSPCSGSAAGVPSNPTKCATPWTCCTRSRSPNAIRTKTYPGNSGRSNVTRRSFHRRTDEYSGRKWSHLSHAQLFGYPLLVVRAGVCRIPLRNRVAPPLQPQLLPAGSRMLVSSILITSDYFSDSL